jgi:NAD(P)-dependent dehydrogenase (short-subunit alcohol dehydrogenase family)
MANVTRYAGDTKGVVNVDRSRADAPAAQIISTGVGKHITAIKINGADFTNELGVGGAVEGIIRTLQVKATTIAYQVDAVTVGNATVGQLSVIVEATGWGTTNPATGAVVTTADADLQAAINALGVRSADATIPVDAYDFTAVTVSSTEGLKLA